MGDTAAAPIADVRKRRFHSRSSAVDVLKDIDITGKTALITGTNSGIGTAVRIEYRKYSNIRTCPYIFRSSPTLSL